MGKNRYRKQKREKQARLALPEYVKTSPVITNSPPTEVVKMPAVVATPPVVAVDLDISEPKEVKVPKFTPLELVLQRASQQANARADEVSASPLSLKFSVNMEAPAPSVRR